MKLAAGNNFTGSKTDTAHFILNETAVRLTGIKDPIGKRFKLQQTEGTIIGVLKDYNFTSLKDKIEPAVIYFKPQGYVVYIKTTGREAPKAIAAAGRLWKKYNPGFPFTYTFLDEDYAGLYRTEERTGALFNIFSLIAVGISCLGLFGLATYSAQVRTKEIGIRKVLGASVPGIVSLVSAGFLKLVLLAVLIAIPVAWWAMNGWLQNFAYRIDIPWTVFLLAGAMAVFMALVTVSFQAIKAALANPVDSLRTE
jgi:putative ABC transport system permease protein